MPRLREVSRTYLILAAALTIGFSIFLFGFARSSEQRPSWQTVLDSVSKSSRTTSTDGNANSHGSILNETLGFQKIIVINLPSRTDNRDAMSLAASLTGLKLEFVDGVTEFDMEHALPVRPADLAHMGPKGNGFGKKVYGSWRAHMNAVRKIVEENLTSALILEDDGDWDVRIKDQLQTFAKASRLLIQPVKGTTNTFLDPSNPRQSREDEIKEIDINHSENSITEPTTSPYGDIDRWDVLWLGHCGNHPPDKPSFRHPLGRVVIPNDPSAIQTQHYDPGYGDNTVWPSYPNHTRLVTHARVTVCNLAYGVSLPGARRLLYQMGVKNQTGTTDTMLRQICDGDAGWTKRTCLSTIPPLFEHHRPKAYPRSVTHNIKYGTKANFATLVDGQTDYFDAWPDNKPKPKYFYGRDSQQKYLKWQEQKAKQEQAPKDEHSKDQKQKAQVNDMWGPKGNFTKVTKDNT